MSHITYISQYLAQINKRFLQGDSTEHTFRGDLQQVIEQILPEIQATNEPRRQQCGAPDYVLTQNGLPVAFIEAKNLGDKDLYGKNKAGNKAQFDRYKLALGRVMFTDYLRFLYFQEGELVEEVQIGELSAEGIRPLPENYNAFYLLLKVFCEPGAQTLSNPRKLAAMMANKARLLAEVMERALIEDTNNQEETALHDQFEAFKKILIQDISPKAFADVYAQTIAYGLFAARYHSPKLNEFSRQEAAVLIPQSNPFLRKLFQYIAGFDLDDRIRWVVDSLVEVFLACNVRELLQDFGKETRQEDPIIHFYETFLSEYDPALRKTRGVWYTPQPIVNFIVRTVDEVLKTDFKLKMGLVDTEKLRLPKPDAQDELQEVHRVQILDPAAGTGTFLVETRNFLSKKSKAALGLTMCVSISFLDSMALSC